MPVRENLFEDWDEYDGDLFWRHPYIVLAMGGQVVGMVMIVECRDSLHASERN